MKCNVQVLVQPVVKPPVRSDRSRSRSINLPSNLFLVGITTQELRPSLHTDSLTRQGTTQAPKEAEAVKMEPAAEGGPGSTQFQLLDPHIAVLQQVQHGGIPAEALTETCQWIWGAGQPPLLGAKS